MLSYGMTIAGESVPGEDTFPVLDPGTGEEVGRAPECGSAELNLAMESAEDAFATWSQVEEVRRGAIRSCAEVLDENAEELGRLLTLEQGKPLPDAVHEIHAAELWFRYYAELELPVATIQDDEAGFVQVFRRPLGVVAAIAPWNYPIVQMAWKVAPAFLAGNAVVVKPS
ncbi:MAG: aldehyde dehydrogenase family protein, partial [Solirubrobacterales bacterium]